MTVFDFEAKYNGQPIDFDMWFGDQCVDLMNQYLQDVCGITNPMQAFPGDTAYDIYQNANDARFDKIDNNPDDPNQIPSPGAIIFWKANVSGVTGDAGHVAVWLRGNVGENKFTSFDQNYPTGSLCHDQDHTYDGVAGWLQLKTQDTNDVNQLKDDLLKANTVKDQFYNQLQTALHDKSLLQDQVTTLTQQNTQLQTEKQQLRDANDKITEADKNTGAELLSVSHQRDDYRGFLDSLFKLLEIPLPQDYTGVDISNAEKKIDALSAPHTELVQQYTQNLDAAWQNLVKQKQLTFLQKVKLLFS